LATVDTDIASALRTAIADKVGAARFGIWFGGVRLEVSAALLTVVVPNRFFSDFLRGNFRAALEAAAHEVLGPAASLAFRIDADAGEVAAVEPAGTSSSEAVSSPSAVAEPAEVVEAPLPARRPAVVFESFAVGQNNRMAYAAAEIAARQPGRMTPLTLYGPTGVGKTHLLQAIANEARRQRPTLRTLYLTAEQFMTSFVDAVRGSGMPSFRRKYRGVELLVLDDLHFLSGKRSTLVELLHTLDEMLHAGRQVVFAADRPLADIGGLGTELRSRLEGGLACQIEPPELATRQGIVTQLARRFAMQLPSDVIEFVAASFANHARELSGALWQLHAASEARQCGIDLGLAREVLAELVRTSSKAVSLSDIERAVCDEFGVGASQLQSPCKAKTVSHPRMLAMWLARKHTRAALTEIGDFFGRRTHSTVISAQKRIDDWLAAGTPIELASRPWKLDDAIRRVEKRLQAC